MAGAFGKGGWSFVPDLEAVATGNQGGCGEPGGGWDSGCGDGGQASAAARRQTRFIDLVHVPRGADAALDHGESSTTSNARTEGPPGGGKVAAHAQPWMSLVDWEEKPDEKSSHWMRPTRRPRVAASTAMPQPMALPTTTSMSIGSPAMDPASGARCAERSGGLMPGWATSCRAASRTTGEESEADAGNVLAEATAAARAVPAGGATRPWRVALDPRPGRGVGMSHTLRSRMERSEERRVGKECLL